MKNNEIMISVKMQYSLNNEKEAVENRERTFSFLVKNNITLKELIQGLYYGLKKLSVKDTSCVEWFEFFEHYIKTHENIAVLYTIMGKHRNLDFKEEIDIKGKKEKVYNCCLTELGIVTSSEFIITDKAIVGKADLFKKSDKGASYILENGKNTEYNISSRRLNVIEPTEIDILPAGDVPENKKDSFWAVIVPPLMTAGAMFAVRSIVSDSSASMLAMSVAMPIVSAVNTAFNYFRQNNKAVDSIDEWKKHYEEYIAQKIKLIRECQRDEIIYLNRTYPQVNELFRQISIISNSIFCRSQNDNDFMRISLGLSDKVKPLFKINAEEKDDIFYDVRYHLVETKKDVIVSQDDLEDSDFPRIEIFLPQAKKGILDTFLSNIRNLLLNKSESNLSDVQNVFLLTELQNVFATTQDVIENGKRTRIGFKYLRNDFKNAKENEKKPPLLVDLKNIGTLGVIPSQKIEDIPSVNNENKSNNESKSKNEWALNFIRHLAFELAFYHSPEDLQMVFFFDKESDSEKQREIAKNYMFLPHTNELFDNLSQFVFDEKSAGTVFSALQSIMFERSKLKSDENDTTDEKLTQIICFFLCDYDIKGTAFSKFIPEVPKEGESYIRACSH